MNGYYAGKIKVVCEDLMCFPVRASDLEPTSCSSYDPWALSDPDHPVTSTLVVIMFYVMFSLVEANIEKAIFGSRFEHPLDAVFAVAFMAYAAYAVYWCAMFNSSSLKGR